MLTNRIEATNNAKFKDLALGFRLELKQDGDRVTGTGTKVSENEQVLAPTRQTPISVEGPMAGDRLELTFTERGAQRATTGKLSLQLADDGTLRGTFSSDAAKTRGSSEAARAR